jgi:hypothetical protein
MKTANPILVVDDDPVCCRMTATLLWRRMQR